MMAPQQLVIIFLLLNVINTISQQCISSPPEMEWKETDGDFYGTITMDSNTFTINDITFTTRVLNSQIPAPTIRMIPGRKYFITINNNLGPEQQGTINTIRDLNYTTIHTHGLHISGEAPADNVWTVADPGESFTAIYEPPCFHSGGTFWYHPHHHGSNAIQIGGGAAGALIMEPNEYESASFPSWYTALYDSELILVVQYLSLAEVATLGSEAAIPDRLFKTSEETDFYVINGLYQPTICLSTNIWKKLRISHINIQETVILKIIDPNDSCSLYLLSKDGVLIHGIDNTVPREIPSKEVYLTVASRADVVVRCTNDGIYNLEATNIPIDPEERPGTTSVIGYVQVTTTKIKAKGNDLLLSNANSLTKFNPLRPKYLQSLLFYDGYLNEETIILDVVPVPGEEDTFEFTLGGEVFQGPNNYLFETDINIVQEWTIIEVDEVHPYHQHLNHFQFIEKCNDGHPDGWSQIGDWIDTVDFSTKIRFVTNTFGGGKVIHCHILRHEDFGMMSVVKINGGCDAFYEDFDKKAGDGLGCDYDRDMCKNSGDEIFSDYNWYWEALDFEEPACATPENGEDGDGDGGSDDSGSSDGSSDSMDSSDSVDEMNAFGDEAVESEGGYEGHSGEVLMVFTMVGFVIGIICIALVYQRFCDKKKKKNYDDISAVDVDEKQEDIHVEKVEMVENVIIMSESEDSGYEGDEGVGWMKTGK